MYLRRLATCAPLIACILTIVLNIAPLSAAQLSPPGHIYDTGGWRGTAVVVADVNGDGKPDMLIGNFCEEGELCGATNGVLGVLLGNGDGTFQTAKTYPTGGDSANSIAVADLNGDGKLDVAVAHQNGLVGILLGNGDGTFRTPVTYSTGNSAALAITLADLDGDGKLEAVVATYNTNGGAGAISVLPGNGDGTFGQPALYSTAVYPYSVAVADLGADGRPDIVVLNGAGVVGVLENCSGMNPPPECSASNGTFLGLRQVYQSDYTSQGPQSILLADVNGDGILDLLVADQCQDNTCNTGAGVAVLFGNGDGSFQAPQVYPATLGRSGSMSITLADVNGDGHPDVLAAGCGTSCEGAIAVLLNNSDGTFQPGQLYDTRGYEGYALAAADVNADGKQDVVVTNIQASGYGSAVTPVSVMIGNGDGSFRSPNMATTTSLTSSVNPSLVGQTVTLTATVAPLILGWGAPTGSINFKQGTMTLATVTLNNAAQATYTTSYSMAGTRMITATYSGDSNYVRSSSAMLKQVVTKVSTTTSVSSSVNPSNVGDAVTFTATVTPSNTGLGLPSPTGTVTFKNGTTALGTGTLSGGTATLTTSSLPAGTLSITAMYAGDTKYMGSTSPKLSQVVNGLPTTTGISSSVNPSSYGQMVTFTATVTPNSGTGVPTGKVTFKSGAVILGTATLSSGTASYSQSTLTYGTKSITAVYSGDSTYAPSTSPVLSQIIYKASTTTALSSSANPSTSGQSVTFTATVSPQYSGTPDGSVTFTLDFSGGHQILGTVRLSGGSASYTTSALPQGSDDITATYNGSANFSLSVRTIKQQVN